MGDLLNEFKLHLTKEFPFLHPRQYKLLLAVSGGLDSVVLTDLFSKAGFDFIIAHCNFQLRGEESNRDEQFVLSLGEKYNRPVLVNHFDTEKYAQQNKLSIQEAARKLRYDWFEELLESEKLNVKRETLDGKREYLKHADSVDEANAKTQPANDIHSSPFTFHLATAHHANDNIETLLLNLFRGTGISGLHGIPAKQGYIIRPLLFAKREDILAYAKENGLQWVEDSSNASDKYTRNFIRLQMLPAVKEIFSNAEDNLLQNIERFKDAELLYAQAINAHKKKLLEQKGNEWHIPVLKLQKVVPLQTIVWEIIKEFGFSSAQTPEVIKLLQADNGSYIASASHRVIKNRGWLIIAPQLSAASQTIVIEEGDKKLVFENGRLEIEIIPNTQSAPSSSPLIASLDAGHVQFPLLLRKWKQGDYFYPLGMQKKKKLSRFFIDQKLSATDKEKVWVLEMNKKIIWVIGLRIDDRFKILPSTKNILRVNFIKSL